MMPNRIRELRKARRLSLEKLGALCATSAQQMACLEHETVPLTAEWMRQIAAALEVGADELLADNDVTWRLTEDEARLLRSFRRVAPGLRGQVLDVVAVFAAAADEAARPAARGDTGDDGAERLGAAA
jgi:transcriptional regulator with XRE-family HTH domain